jgi:hypothetical protein
VQGQVVCDRPAMFIRMPSGTKNKLKLDAKMTMAYSSVTFKGTILMALLIMPIIAAAQNSEPGSIWQPLKFLVGTWTGKGGGEPGIGEYERTYKFIFNKKFLEVKNKSAYPPTEKNPKGEVHEDIGYMSYDTARHSFVLRQFHIEGFVNQYRLDNISTDGKKIVFISEAIENIPPGWRAKEIYQILGDREFTETFELAPPGKDFEVYSTVTLRRSN